MPDDAHGVSVIDLRYPVLDVFHTNPTVTSRFWVVFDTTRGPRNPKHYIRQIHYSSSGRELQLDPASDSAEGIISVETSNSVVTKVPDIAHLYPLLSMQSKPSNAGQNREEADDDVEAAEEDDGGAPKPSKKRPAESPAVDTSGRTGKRAAARAETQRRLKEQEQKKKK